MALRFGIKRSGPPGVLGVFASLLPLAVRRMPYEHPGVFFADPRLVGVVDGVLLPFVLTVMDILQGRLGSDGQLRSREAFNELLMREVDASTVFRCHLASGPFVIGTSMDEASLI